MAKKNTQVAKAEEANVAAAEAEVSATTLSFLDEADKSEAKFDAALVAANTALKANDAEAYAKAIATMGEAEKGYALNFGKAYYVQTRDDAEAGGLSPIREIIKAYAFPVIGHKEVSEGEGADRHVTEVQKVTKDKQIDLVAFCKVNSIATPWADTVSKMNQLMCLRTATSIGYNAKELRTLEGAYYLREAAKDIDIGKTPTSNTQMCKLLQAITDCIIMPEEGETFGVNNHDVAYLDALYAKKSSKSRLTLTVSKDAFLLRLLVDVSYRLLTGSRYGVDGFKTKKKN